MTTARRILSLCAIVGALGTMLLLKVSCGHSRPQRTEARGSAKPLEPTPFDSSAPIQIESLGVQVKASRTWATALAPNSRGGWNFITQSYELHSPEPTEFVVVDLETGKTTITEGIPKIYTNSNFNAAKQLRAANGRIFLLESQTSLAYYEPADETVKTLGSIMPVPGANTMLYQATFGPDGKLYIGTQSNALPTILQLDPVTLKAKVLGEVGKDRLGYSYAYDLAVDPPWVYVTVGESPWELAALNLETGVSKILATRTDKPWMKLEHRPEGITATLITGLKTPQAKNDVVWCVDGKTLPFEPKYDPAKLPFKPRDVKPHGEPVQAPPELELSAVTPDSNGEGRISWRPAGTKAWREQRYQIKNTSPVDIESLVALPDGSILGNAQQYHGFFRFDPKAHATTFFGASGPSRGPRTVMNGLVYITGYPNAVLYAYDPAKPWTAKAQDKDHDPSANPRWLGNFEDAGAHYSYFLVPADNGRLYFAGRRERVGIGGAIGYYEPSTGKFAGHHDDLSFLDPQGLVALDRGKRIVFSGKLHDDPALPGKTPEAASLVVYDGDLHEVYRQIVNPGLHDTGQLFTTSEPSVVFGLVGTEKVIYRYDVVAKKLLDSQPLKGALAAAAQRPSDGSIWIVLDRSLVRIDPETLESVTIGKAGDVPSEARHLTWQGENLYFAVAGELRRISRVGIR